MRKVRVEKAVGTELCHDITAMREDFKGPAFRRGRVITKEDIPQLLDIGKCTGLNLWSGRSWASTPRGFRKCASAVITRT